MAEDSMVKTAVFVVIASLFFFGKNYTIVIEINPIYNVHIV